MTLADRNNFEKAYNRLSHIISTIDNCNNKEALESVRQISNAMGSKLNINEIAEKAKSLQAGVQAEKNAEAGKNVEAPKKGGPKL